MTAVSAQQLTAAELLAVSPVVPVVVVDDVEQAVPLARALARGGVGIIEITLRTAAGLGAIERVAAEVPEILTGAGTVDDPGGGRGGTSRRGPVHRHTRVASQAAGGGAGHRPPGPGRVVHAHRDDAAGRAGAHGDEVLPGRGQWRAPLPLGGRRPDARAPVLPDRWDLDGQRRRLPRAAQRRLCRRVVAHAQGRRGRRATGRASRTSPGRPRPCAAELPPRAGGGWPARPACAAGLPAHPAGPGQGTAREFRRRPECDGRVAHARGLR